MDDHTAYADYTRPRPSLLSAIARAVAWGGITLIDPNKQVGWRKQAYWGALAAVSAWEAAAADDTPPAVRAGLGLGMAGVTFGAQDLWAKGDAWTMRLTEKVAPKQPRAIMAIASAAVSLGSSLALRAVADNADDDDYAYVEGQAWEPEELSPHVRGLLVTLLDGIEGYGAEDLRAQLNHATMVDEDGAIAFVVDDDAPRALIKDYVFPARVEFDRDGRTHIVELIVEDGALASLNHYSEPSWEDGEDEPNWDLPASDELRVAVGQ